jgi:hypothetical protein
MASSDADLDAKLLNLGQSQEPQIPDETLLALPSRQDASPPLQDRTDYGLMSGFSNGSIRGLKDIANTFMNINDSLVNLYPGGNKLTDPGRKSRDQALADFSEEFGKNPLAQGSRLAMNVAGTLPFMSIAPEASSGLVGNILQGVVSSALLSGGSNERMQDQLGAGAIGGALLPAGLKIAGAALSPQIAPAAQYLRSLGVNLTPGQLLGGGAAKAEQAMANTLPITGDLIKNRLIESHQSLNKAVANFSLAPIGAKIPESVQPGNASVDYVSRKLGDEYDSTLAKGSLDPTNIIGNMHLVAQQIQQQLPKEQADALTRIIQNKIIDSVQPGQMISGQNYKGIDSELRHASSTYSKSGQYFDQELAQRIDSVRDYLRSEFDGQNPHIAGQLEPIDQAWARYKRYESASSAQTSGRNDGLFTPEQLNAAVRKGDMSKDKSKYAKGFALMQDLSQSANAVMGNKVPNSGSPYQTAIGLGAGALLGHYAPDVSMNVGAGLGLGSLPYTKSGMGLINSLLSSGRPAPVEGLGGVMRDVAPYSGPAGGIAGNALFRAYGSVPASQGD